MQAVIISVCKMLLENDKKMVAENTISDIDPFFWCLMYVSAKILGAATSSLGLRPKTSGLGLVSDKISNVSVLSLSWTYASLISS